MKSMCCKNLQKFYSTLIVFAVIVVIAGCSGGPVMTTVEGTVSVDGKPLGNGSITFEPADGQGRTAGATIEDGKYVAEVPPGQKKVRITGFEVTGQVPAYQGMPNSPMRDVVKDVVPEKYNAKSQLELSVDTSPTTGNFDLKAS